MSSAALRVSARTLLLNASYEPLRVISWQRAVTLMYLGKVEVLRSYDQVLHAVAMYIETPAVVRLYQLVRRHRVRISFSRRNVFLRDGYRCQYCGLSLSATDLTADHVVPRSLGGATTWENVVTACGPCNLRKGGRTPSQARMVLHRRPQRPAHLPATTVHLHTDSAPAVWHEFLLSDSKAEAVS
jgi:5-methylcytosine-specific restriction endonuclease McrA